jgi:hypothetical protein
VAFGSFKDLKLSEYPELKELWYGTLEHNVLKLWYLGGRIWENNKKIEILLIMV